MNPLCRECGLEIQGCSTRRVFHRGCTTAREQAKKRVGERKEGRMSRKVPGRTVRLKMAGEDWDAAREVAKLKHMQVGRLIRTIVRAYVAKVKASNGA